MGRREVYQLLVELFKNQNVHSNPTNIPTFSIKFLKDETSNFVWKCWFWYTLPGGEVCEMGRSAYENCGQEDKGAFFPIFQKLNTFNTAHSTKERKKESLALEACVLQDSWEFKYESHEQEGHNTKRAWATPGACLPLLVEISSQRPQGQRILGCHPGEVAKAQCNSECWGWATQTSERGLQPQQTEGFPTLTAIVGNRAGGRMHLGAALTL